MNENIYVYASFTYGERKGRKRKATNLQMAYIWRSYERKLSAILVLINANKHTSLLLLFCVTNGPRVSVHSYSHRCDKKCLWMEIWESNNRHTRTYTLMANLNLDKSGKSPCIVIALKLKGIRISHPSNGPWTVDRFCHFQWSGSKMKIGNM